MRIFYVNILFEDLIVWCHNKSEKLQLFWSKCIGIVWFDYIYVSISVAYLIVSQMAYSSPGYIGNIANKMVAYHRRRNKITINLFYRCLIQRYRLGLLMLRSPFGQYKTLISWILYAKRGLLFMRMFIIFSSALCSS